MCKAIDQETEEEGAGDTRSIDCRRLVAEQHAGDRDDERGRNPCQCAVLEVIFSQRGKRKHAVAHRQRNSDDRRRQTAENVIRGR
jgi:hypothetical protein